MFWLPPLLVLLGALAVPEGKVHCVWFLGEGGGDGSPSGSFLYLGFLFSRGSWMGCLRA